MKLLATVSWTAFAPIDLKLARIYIRDGFDNGTSTPTSTAIEPVGETTIALSDATITVPVTGTVKFGTDTQEYSVSSRTLGAATDEVQTGTITGTPTGGSVTLTFVGKTTGAVAFDATAADVELALEALDSVPNGTITCTGGPWPDTPVVATFTGTLEGDQPLITNTDSLTGGAAPALAIVETTPGVLGTTTTEIVITPALLVATTAGGDVTFNGRVLEVTIGEGTVDSTETQARDYILNRGLLNSVRNGDDTPMEVTFDFMWEFLSSVTDSGVPTVRDCLYQINEAAEWVTTSDDACEPYCVDIEVHYDPDCGGDNSELIVYEEFRYETVDQKLSDSTVNVKGKCNKTRATITRGS